jgi:transposase
MLVPPDFNELIAANHPVNVLKQVLKTVDITELVSQYKPKGTNRHHTRMLLKVLAYAYLNNTYRSRKTEESV